MLIFFVTVSYSKFLYDDDDNDDGDDNGTMWYWRAATRNQTENLNEKRTKNKPMGMIRSGPVQWTVKSTPK